MTTQSHHEIERRDIDGTGRKLGELFFNRRYAIDSYQREYKWQTKQLVELVEDLCGKFLEHYEPGQERDSVAKYGHYFLGRSFSVRKKERATSLTASSDSRR